VALEDDSDTGRDRSRIQYGKGETEVARHCNLTAATLTGKGAAGQARPSLLTCRVEVKAAGEDLSDGRDGRRANRADDLVGVLAADGLGQVGLAAFEVESGWHRSHRYGEDRTREECFWSLGVIYTHSQANSTLTITDPRKS